VDITRELSASGLIAGVVRAEGVVVAPAPPALARALSELVAERARQDFPPEAQRTAIRRLLKKGGFKPTGRNKPASEYLAQAAREGRFPIISNLVDVNNYLSLLTGLPISLLDLDVVGDGAVLRLGRAGEAFVFNAAGQTIDVEGLPCVCRAGGPPLGNPVKDAVEAKVKQTTGRVIGVIYASSDCIAAGELKEHADAFARLLRDHAQARETQTLVL